MSIIHPSFLPSFLLFLLRLLRLLRLHSLFLLSPSAVYPLAIVFLCILIFICTHSPIHSLTLCPCPDIAISTTSFHLPLTLLLFFIFSFLSQDTIFSTHPKERKDFHSMTYSQHHLHSESSVPEKVRQETTTTTISSTTTTTASTMPLTSDSEPTYSTNKAHYRPNNIGKSNVDLHHRISTADVDLGQKQHLNTSASNGRSSSPSSTSSNGLNGSPKSNLHPKQQPGLHNHPNSSSSNVSTQGRQSYPPSNSGNRANRDPNDYSNGAHSWPILFAVVPPLGALVFGKSDIWSDILTLALIAFFLYNIIKGMFYAWAHHPSSRGPNLSILSYLDTLFFYASSDMLMDVPMWLLL